MAVYPVASGQPDYSGSFIPEIWAGEFLIKFYSGTCLAQISNTDYQGDIKQKGDTVHINTIPDIASHDYEEGQDLLIDTPDSDPISLYINKGKYFNIAVDDVAAVQSSYPLLEKFATAATDQQKIAIEREVFADIYNDADADNSGATAGAESGGFDLGTSGSAIAITTVNATQKLTDLAAVLDEQNVPALDRSVIIPVWYKNLLQNSDLKNTSLTGDNTSPIRTGLLGEIAGMTVYVSNLLPSVTDTNLCWYVIALHRKALSFAAQFVKTRRMESERTFNTLVSSLNVYGYKVTKPDAMAVLYCYKSA